MDREQRSLSDMGLDRERFPQAVCSARWRRPASDTNYLPNQMRAISGLECGECRTNKLSEQSFAPSVTWNSWTQGESSSAPTQLGTIYPLSKTLSGRAKSVIDLKCSTDSMLHVWPPLAVGGQSSKICHKQNFSGSAECQTLEPRTRSLRSAAILSCCARCCPFPSFR